MKRRYRVFVSYNYYNEDGQGSGNGQLKLKSYTKRLSYKDISEIEEHLAEKYNFDKVIILHYQIM